MKNTIFIIVFCLFIIGQKSFAQSCPMELGYHYNIYIFSTSSDLAYKELLGADVNPMMVNVIQVKIESLKEKIDNQCLTGKLETCIFIYPSKDKTKMQRFCNQIEYANALKNKLSLKIDGE